MPLQAAHARFARMFDDDLAKRLVSDLHLFSRKSVRLQLTLPEIAARDLQFLLFGVATEFDDFHPIPQRCRDGIEHISRADEQHFGQIEGYAQVIVTETVVLLRIEYFQQSRERIALMTRRQLVHLVEHEDRIAAPRFTHGLNDIAGQRTDVRSAMAADFRLVVHAAQTHTPELEAERFRDTLTQRGLTHPGGSNETENRTPAVRIQLAHGEEFEDALFDLVESVMVFIENGAGAFDVQLFGVGLRPWHRNEPVEIGARHRVFGSAVRHTLQAGEFALRLLFCLRRHAGILDCLLQIREFRS